MTEATGKTMDDTAMGAVMGASSMNPVGAKARRAAQAADAVQLEALGGGVFAAPHARIIDRSGRKRFAIGRAEFVVAMREGTLVDKTMLIADVLDSGYAAALFCRPRRFGKTLNMTMMKAYLEAPDAGGLPLEQAKSVFERTEVWDAQDGYYRRFQGAYPVVHFSFSTAKKDTWELTYGVLRNLIATEFLRHSYLRQDGTPLAPEEIAYFNAITGGNATDADYAGSLQALCRMLYAYHGKDVVVLIDEYDAPVMAGYTKGYYDQVVDFLKGWLTGALKDGGPALAFACLTGVQRISKESIFSDLNNLTVSMPLTDDFDERYGFTDAEVAALAAYLGHLDCMPEAREWYDGYRFGNADVYNPWSVINYLNKGCRPGAYWLNTSGNSVVGDLVSQADAETLGDVYSLLEPGGTIAARLDLGVVFPDLGIRKDAVWSMLYLAGYVTTDDVEDPSDEMRKRRMRVPDREVARVFRNEVLRRFIDVAGGDERLDELHRAVVCGDERAFQDELGRIARDSVSYHDLTSELPCHMLLMGLLFGVEAYRDPISNREAGYGRFDIRLEPDPQARPTFARRGPGAVGARPLVTIEVKFLKPADVPKDAEARDAVLHSLAEEALAQIAEGAYDAEPPACAQGRLRWGVAFSGKHVAVACERPATPEQGAGA